MANLCMPRRKPVVATARPESMNREQTDRDRLFLSPPRSDRKIAPRSEISGKGSSSDVAHTWCAARACAFVCSMIILYRESCRERMRMHERWLAHRRTGSSSIPRHVREYCRVLSSPLCSRAVAHCATIVDNVLQ